MYKNIKIIFSSTIFIVWMILLISFATLSVENKFKSMNTTGEIATCFWVYWTHITNAQIVYEKDEFYVLSWWLYEIYNDIWYEDCEWCSSGVQLVLTKFETWVIQWYNVAFKRECIRQWQHLLEDLVDSVIDDYE